MKTYSIKLFLYISIILIGFNSNAQNFQGQAKYVSKTKMDLGNWGSRLSEGQKKQVASRLKNRLEKTYKLTFNMQESMFLEEQQIDAISGATDSWGGYFSRGNQYKNVKENNSNTESRILWKTFFSKR